MEPCPFPGYSRCIACKELIADKDIPNHTLNCRTKSSNEKKLCSLCNKQIDIKQLKQHMQICNQQKNLSRKVKCSICNQFVDDLSAHSQICDIDEDINSEYETSTPSKQNEKTSLNKSNREINKQKRCILCYQLFDEIQYIDHVQFCLNDEQNYSNHQKSSSQIENKSSKRKSMKFCALCEEEINENQYRNHVASCSPHRSLYQ